MGFASALDIYDELWLRPGTNSHLVSRKHPRPNFSFDAVSKEPATLLQTTLMELWKYMHGIETISLTMDAAHMLQFWSMVLSEALIFHLEHLTNRTL